jgi:hypothetical protein
MIVWRKLRSGAREQEAVWSRFQRRGGKEDGTLDLHVTTGLPEIDVEVVLVLEPAVDEERTASEVAAWPERYFEETFGSLRDNPITYEPPPPFERREELH